FSILIPYFAHHRVLHSFPTRRSSDLAWLGRTDDRYTTPRRRGTPEPPRVPDARSRVFPDRRGIVASCTAATGFPPRHRTRRPPRSEEHTSELQSRGHLVCRLLLEKKK